MTSHHLRLIAALTMLIDHVGLYLFGDMLPFRIVGRISFPIFAFLIVVGYHHTHNKKRYLARIALFALISQVPYHLIGNPVFNLNILFTFSLGLLFLWLHDRFPNIFLQYITLFIFCCLAVVLQTDYSYFGILLIYCFHMGYPQQARLTGYAASYIVLSNGLHWLSTQSNGIRDYLSCFHLLAMPFLLFFNGEEGRKAGLFFYWFYPAHLFAIYLVQLIR